LDSDEVRRHLSLVRGIASRVIARLPRSVDLDDLVGAGVLGLLDAAKGFDPSKGVPFARYAEIRIRGAILDELRAGDQTPRSSRRQAGEVAGIVRDLSAALGRPPSPEEVADALGIPVDDYLDRVARIRPVVVVGFDDLMRPGTEDPIDRSRHLWDPDAPDPAAQAEARERAVRMGQAVEQLTPRQRMVVTFHYVEGMSFREIADFLEVTEGRISQLHTASVERLKRLLANPDASPGRPLPSD
jgi:RNA polymerase sigma factor for flagellar operon FliA